MNIYTSLIGVPELQQRALRATERTTIQAETRTKDNYHSSLDRRWECSKVLCGRYRDIVNEFSA
jgi:hypothetical protein